MSVNAPEKDVSMQKATKAPNAEAFIAQQKQALAANPECGNSHYNLGVALLGQGKIEEAEQSSNAAPDWPKPTFRWGASA